MRRLGRVTTSRTIPAIGADNVGRTLPEITVKCSSHAARHRLMRALGRELGAGYYSLWENSMYGVYDVTAAELPTARAVKGVTRHRPRDPDRWGRCINFG